MPRKGKVFSGADFPHLTVPRVRGETNEASMDSAVATAELEAEEEVSGEEGLTRTAEARRRFLSTLK